MRCEGVEFEQLALQLLGCGRGLRFRARGSSMYPAVRDGDILEVSPAANAELEIGDIVLYRSPRSGIVVHRVASVRRQDGRNFLEVRGDASCRADPRVPESQVLGKVVSIVRQGRIISPSGSASRHVAPLLGQLFRLRHSVYVLLKPVLLGLRKAISAIGSGI